MSDTTTPPSPEGVPVLGHGYAFSRDPFGSLERWADHGDVVRLEFPGQTIYMLSEPSLIEAVFLDSDGRFTISDQQRETFEGIEPVGDPGDLRVLRREHPAAYDVVVIREDREVEAPDPRPGIDLVSRPRAVGEGRVHVHVSKHDSPGGRVGAKDVLIDRAPSLCRHTPGIVDPLFSGGFFLAGLDALEWRCAGAGLIEREPLEYCRVASAPHDEEGAVGGKGRSRPHASRAPTAASEIEGRAHGDGIEHMEIGSL